MFSRWIACLVFMALPSVFASLESSSDDGVAQPLREGLPPPDAEKEDVVKVPTDVENDGDDDDDEEYDDSGQDSSVRFVSFPLFVSLRQNDHSIGFVLKEALSQYLDWNLRDYRVAESRKELATIPATTSTIADLVLLQGLRPHIWAEQGEINWWRYSFKYFCYWYDTNTTVDRKTWEIIDADVRSALELAQYVHDELRQALSEEFESYFDVQIPDFLQIHIDPPDLETPASNETIFPPNVPCCNESDSSDSDESETEAPSISTQAPNSNATASENQIGTQLNVQDWGWRRFTGLGILLTTVLGTLFLIQLSNLRKRIRAKEQAWKNIATEEGVDELLRMGWKVRGAKLEVYDKKKSGYRDGDSILVGGCHQTGIHEAGAATEYSTAKFSHHPL